MVEFVKQGDTDHDTVQEGRSLALVLSCSWQWVWARFIWRIYHEHRITLMYKYVHFFSPIPVTYVSRALQCLHFRGRVCLFPYLLLWADCGASFGKQKGWCVCLESWPQVALHALGFFSGVLPLPWEQARPASRRGRVWRWAKSSQLRSDETSQNPTDFLADCIPEVSPSEVPGDP